MAYKNSKPTQPQLEVYFFLVQYVAAHGFQPSQRELAERFGIKQASMSGRLKGLAEHGLVEFPDAAKRDRAIRLKRVSFSPSFDKTMSHMNQWIQPMLGDC